ncbi:MAG: hypothetical protein OEY49_00325 [Candidatus Heimdallarchaeota archaeon]|nr:hypothetical protein [Candidatus Heimdallarchaeota archaeon]
MNYRELYLNGKSDELYEATKTKLDDLKSIAYHLCVIHTRVNTEEFPTWDDLYDKTTKYKGLFEENKESNPFEYAVYSYRLGYCLYVSKGEIDEAINRCLESVFYFRQHDPLMLASPLQHLSIFYSIKGDIKKSIEMYKEITSLPEEISKFKISETIQLAKLKLLYYEGKYDESLKLGIYHFNSIVNDDNILKFFLPLYDFCHLMMLAGKRDGFLPLLNLAEQVVTKHPNHMHRFLRIKALFLKYSKRTLQKAEAERILRELIKRPSPWPVNILHLCDLLVIELKTYGEKEVYEELQEYINLLFEKSLKTFQYSIFSKAVILKSRILIIDGKFTEADSIIKDAISMFETKNLEFLVEELNHEQLKIEGEFNKLKELFETNEQYSDKLDKLQINEYIAMVDKLI